MSSSTVVASIPPVKSGSGAGSTALATTSPDDLIPRIRDAHRLCRRAMQAGLAHALEAGRLLGEAKAQCPHGEWGRWLTEKCRIPERTAQAYLRVSRGFEGADPQRVADLSFRGALKMLSAPRQATSEPSPYSAEALIDEMFDEMLRWEPFKERLKRMSFEEVVPFARGEACLMEVERESAFFDSLLVLEARLGFARGEFFEAVVGLAEKRLRELGAPPEAP